MSYVFGAVLIVVGLAQILLRAGIVRANAASNAAMYNGRLAGPGFQSYAKVMAVIVGVIFIAVGLYLLIAHPGMHGSHG
jgi:hypothetical protein